MKKLAPRIIQAALAILASALPALGQETWSALYGGDGGEEMEGLAITRAGNVVIAGSTDSFRDENGDAWIIELGPSGKPVWAKTYGGPGNEYAIDIKTLPQGGFIVAGWTESFGQGQADVWVMRLDAEGDVVWANAYGGPGIDQAWAIAPTRDGGFVVAAGTTSFGAGESDLWLFKLDGQGSIVWQKTLGGPKDDGGGGSYGELVVRVLEDTQGNYVVASETYSFGAGESDVWVIKLDPQGSLLWQHAYGGQGEDSLWSFAETKDGGYLLPGVSSSFNADGDGDIWVVKIDGNGEVVWEYTYGIPGMWDEALSVTATPDGGALVGGYVEEGDRDWDWLLLRLAADGRPLWQRRYEYGWDWPNALSPLAGGGFVVAGVAWAKDRGEAEDLWVMRLDRLGRAGSGCGIESAISPRRSVTRATVTPTRAIPRETRVQPLKISPIVERQAIRRRVLCGSETALKTR